MLGVCGRYVPPLRAIRFNVSPIGASINRATTAIMIFHIGLSV